MGNNCVQQSTPDRIRIEKGLTDITCKNEIKMTDESNNDSSGRTVQAFDKFFNLKNSMK